MVFTVKCMQYELRSHTYHHSKVLLPDDKLARGPLSYFIHGVTDRFGGLCGSVTALILLWRANKGRILERCMLCGTGPACGLLERCRLCGTGPACGLLYLQPCYLHPSLHL